MICAKCGHDTLYRPASGQQTAPGHVSWIAPQVHPDVALKLGIQLDDQGRMVWPTPKTKG